MSACLYTITNLLNGHHYVGVSVNYKYRWKTHIQSSEKEKPKFVVARALKKYGQHFFDFVVVKKFKTVHEAWEAEKDWIRKKNPEYNVALGGEAPMLGRTHTPEVRRILAEKTRQQFTGQKQSRELVEKRAAALRGRPLSKEHREKISQVLSNSRRQVESHYKIVICENDGLEYQGIQAAADQYNLTYYAVQRSCLVRWKNNGRGRPSTINMKGLLFKFKER